MRNKNRLTSLLLALIFTLGITINSIVPIYTWILGGGKGDTVSYTPENSLVYTFTSILQVRSYVISLVRCVHKNGIFDEEIVLCFAIVEGNQNAYAGNTPLEQTYSYFVYEIKSDTYCNVTKIDFIYNEQVVLRPMGQWLPRRLPKGTIKELTIYPKSNYEQVIEYYTKRKLDQPPDPNIKPDDLSATYLVYTLINSKNFIFVPSEDQEDILEDVKNGDLAIHIEETKPNKVTLTGSQL